MKCPTCEDAKENKCCWCEKFIPEEIQKLKPDSYAEEIDGDKRLHLQCILIQQIKTCRKNSVYEI